MKAGEELDALIAERIFGLVPCQAECHKEGAAKYIPGPCYAQPDSPTQGGELSAYSTDIAAAWKVVEKIQQDDPFRAFFFMQTTGGLCKAHFYDAIDGSRNIKDDPTIEGAALAICLAALAAVGEPVSVG